MLKGYEEYKRSDSNWITKVPAHWKVTTLRALLKNVSEKNYPHKELLSVTREKGVILRNVESKEENHNYVPDDLSNYKLVKKGQFVINKMKSWQGSYGVSDYEGIVSPAYFTFDLEFENVKYFNKAIRSKAYVPFFAQYSVGIRVGQWDLDINKLKNFPFYIPPRQEQDKIVQYLDWKTSEMNRFICQKKKQIKLLEELKGAIINKIIFSGIHNVEKKETKCNWIPDIPKHWKLKKAKVLFKEVVDTGYGNELPLLSITNKDGVVLQSETGRKRRMSEDASGYKRIKPGDIGYNLMNAFIGSLGVSEYDGLISPAYAVCRPIVKMCSKYYQYVYRTPQFLQEFENNSYGIMIERNRLYFDSFKQIMAPVPPYEEQIGIVEYLEKRLAEIDEMISSIQKEIFLVEELKVKLISDVVTGQVDVRDIKIPTYETETDNIETEDDSEEISDEQIFDESIEE